MPPQPVKSATQQAPSINLKIAAYKSIQLPLRSA
jgi:hypothetical protein